MSPRIVLLAVTAAILSVALSAPAATPDEIKAWIAKVEQTTPPATANPNDWDVARGNAFKQLTAAGTPAVEPLVDLIKRTKDDQVKITALVILSKMQDSVTFKPAGDVLPALLKDKNVGIRYAAVKMAGKMKHTPSAPAIEGFVAAPEASLSLAAIDALGNIRALRSSTILFNQLKSADKNVEAHTIRALGNLGVAIITDQNNNPSDIVAALADKIDNALKPQNADKAIDIDDAIAAVRKITGDDLTQTSGWLIKQKRAAIMADFRKWWDAAKDNAKFPIAGNAELQLRVNLAMDGTQSESVRLAAIAMMAHIADAQAADYFVILMGDQNKKVRAAAADAATALTGIQIKYNNENEADWMDKVNRFQAAVVEWKRSQP